MELLLYSASWCPDCRIAKRFLEKHGTPYKEINIEATQAPREKSFSAPVSAPFRNS